MKKGFTLIETLAVLIILGLLMLFTYTKVSNSIDKSEDTLKEAQISNIKAASQNWVTDNIDLLPEDGKSKNIGLKDLEKYIDTSEIKNKDVCVVITKKDDNFIYDVKESC